MQRPIPHRWIQPPRQRRSQQTLERLLDAAEALIEEKGFEDTTLADVALRAGSGLFEAPYTRYYWKPKSIDEAVQYILKAEKGELPVTPDPEGLKEYLHSAYTWPRSRPSSFVIGDAILNLLDMPTNGDGKPEPLKRDGYRTFKNMFYRYVPGSISFMTIRFFARILISPDRHHLGRYHYFSWLYPHRRDARELFTRLQERESSSKGDV